MMSCNEFRNICDAVGGPKAVAEFVPATLRAVDHWRAGTRTIRPPVEARIRELYRRHREARMKALSILQPWAWLIANGYKPIENRTWNTKFRGEFLIHASKGFDKAGYAWVRDNFPEIDLPLPQQFERGGIVGKASLEDVVTASTSPWFFGPVGFCLTDAKPLPFVAMAGKLGFFEVAMTLPGGVA